MQPNGEVVIEKVREVLHPAGFESYPFKIGWYNEHVQPVFALDYPYDTLAFIVISTPTMFDKAFKPFICRQDCLGARDPIDECIAHYFASIKQMFADEDVEVLHDFDLHPSRRPKVLVQTAGHVAGAAYYYQKSSVTQDPWGDKKKIFGVSVHPKYGGWFGLRGVLIFKNLQHTALQQTEPPDVVPTDELRIELLNRFNNNWQDWTYRDIITVDEQYSDEQKTYFATLPKNRKELIEKMKEAPVEAH